MEHNSPVCFTLQQGHRIIRLVADESQSGGAFSGQSEQRLIPAAAPEQRLRYFAGATVAPESLFRTATGGLQAILGGRGTVADKRRSLREIEGSQVGCS